MGRKENRLKRKLEKNPAKECTKIQKKFCPDLMLRFHATEDPRNPSYIEYSNQELLGELYIKGLTGLVSMREMTERFNDGHVSRSICQILGVEERDYLAHHQTLNDYLSRLEPNQLQEVVWGIVYDLIRKRTFEEARFRKRWLVIIDGTQIYSGDRMINEGCMERHFRSEDGEETVSYYSGVLEAKLYLGNDIIVSIGSEFIENNGEDYERQKEMGAEEFKQDCELKAFYRLAEKIKKRFPRLPVCILGDSLYANQNVFKICEAYHWDYLIRFKDGSIPEIAKEYEAIPEKEQIRHAEYINGIGYKEYEINMLKYKEGKGLGFQWITSIKITKENAEKMAMTGRLRWKIENRGFRRQKNDVGDIEHVCCHNVNARKNHYLMLQISDLFRQLYEYYILKKNGIEKTQKNISSDLLASFARHLTGEDISFNDELENTVLV